MSRFARSAELASRLVNRLAITANVLGTVVVLLLVVVINVDVIARSLFIAPLRGAVEIVEISIVAIVFLQIADVVRTGRMTRSDAVLERVTEASPRAGHLMRRAFDLVSAGFMAIVLVAIVPEIFVAYGEGAYVGTDGVFTAPEWPLKLIIAIGAVLCCARWLLDAVRPAEPLRPGLSEGFDESAT